MSRDPTARERGLAWLNAIRRPGPRAFPGVVPVIAMLFVASVFVRGWMVSSEWEPAVRVDILEEEGVVYNEKNGFFVVDAPDGPLALSEQSPHLGDRLIFCESSGLFESPAHGEKFDRRGRYFGGPAPRGMDRYEARIRGAAVIVNTTVVIPGPPRGRAGEPEGDFCSEHVLTGRERGIVPVAE